MTTTSNAVAETLDLSVIVPVFNSAFKMSECLRSLGEIPESLRHEVIFVDDCSTDDSPAKIDALLAGRPNWRLLQLEANSGSPSAPRNRGLREARGEFIFFLDGDDAIYGNAVEQAVIMSRREGLDMVRGSIELNSADQSPRIVDRVPATELTGDVRSKLFAIARHQSLTCSALFRRDLLVSLGARFDETVHMGEDVAFVAMVAVNARDIGYLDTPLFRYIKHLGGGGSAMHSMGSRELVELSLAWTRVEAAFQTLNLSWLAAHGRGSIAYAIGQLIRFCNEEISVDSFDAFAAFVRSHADELGKISFPPRTEEVLHALRDEDYEAFCEAIRPRLLIAGHDLKFIEGAEGALASRFTVRFDRWANEQEHDSRRSLELIEWADLVWVEWMAEAAVWYSHNVPAGKTLIVRVHRYELGRDYGLRLRERAVSAFVTIALHCYEDLIDGFGFSRDRVHFLPNFYQEADYVQGSDPERVYNLALVGSVPKLKGLLRAYELLKNLRAVDSRYNLTVLGHKPEELAWVESNEDERRYYEASSQFLTSAGLASAVKHIGWANTKTALQAYGFVLSMSDIEGSHVSPGEAFCSGNQGVFRRWRGVEYLYPPQYIFDSIDDMTAYILENRKIDVFEENARTGASFVRDNYGLADFVERVIRLWRLT